MASSKDHQDDERSLLKEEVEDDIDCSVNNASGDVDMEVEAIGCGFFHFRMVAILGLGNASDAVEILAMNYILADYGRITPWESSFLTAAVFAGMLVGGLVGGVLADKFGRRPIVLLNLAINAISALFSAVSPTISALIFFRTCAGFGIVLTLSTTLICLLVIGVGGIVSCLFALCVEHLPVAARGRHITILCSFWMLGSILTAATAWIMLGKTLTTHERILPWCNWRYFAAWAGLPAFLCGLLVFFYVPESPRFLVSQKKFDEASAVLKDIIVLNGLTRRVPHLAPPDDVSKTKTFGLRHLFSPSLRLTAMCLIVTAFALSFGSYGISTWITKLFVNIGLSNPYANAFLYAGANLPGNLFSYAVVDAWGAPTLVMASLVAAAACAMLFSIEMDDSKTMIVFLSCLFNALTTSAWNAFGVASTNAFPLAVRVSGLAVVNSMGRLGAISAQFVNGFLMGPPPHLMALLLVTACVLLVGAAAVRCIKTIPDHLASSSSLH
ncbi:unnamed protein product [Aphanomyces euteiches]